jgi:hypothetical protein
VLSLLDLKPVSIVLVLPASAGISLAIVAAAAWLAWLTHTGMVGAVILTANCPTHTVDAIAPAGSRRSPL